MVTGEAFCFVCCCGEAGLVGTVADTWRGDTAATLGTTPQADGLGLGWDVWGKAAGGFLSAGGALLLLRLDDCSVLAACSLSKREAIFGFSASVGTAPHAFFLGGGARTTGLGLGRLAASSELEGGGGCGCLLLRCFSSGSFCPRSQTFLSSKLLAMVVSLALATFDCMAHRRAEHQISTSMETEQSFCDAG